MITAFTIILSLVVGYQFGRIVQFIKQEEEYYQSVFDEISKNKINLN